MSHDPTIEPTLRAVEPALRLVPERHLRQVIEFLTDRGRVLPSNPDLPYWFSRADLEAADVLTREVMAGTEPRLLLVTDPNDRLIEHKPRAEQLRVYWRVLFRAAILNAVDAQLAAKTLTPELCAERLNAFGSSAAREIRYVLESEHLAPEGAGDAAVYRMFAAVYLDLDHFNEHAAHEFFPALPHDGRVRELLSAGIPVAQVAEQARPQGAEATERAHETPGPEAPQPVSATPPTGDSAARLQRAQDAEQKGNFVRAAILRTQVAEVSSAGARGSATAGAHAALKLLVERLGDVLAWDNETRGKWHEALMPLLPLAAAGIWPRAARCLYELQRIPADLGREVYAVDLPEAVRTLGRRPVRRHLPLARPVMVLMALHKAHNQLLRAGLAAADQERLDALMHEAREDREGRIRRDFTPVMVTALSAAGLNPSNRVEEVARDKVVAELLDRVCERGFLRIGNLRDAVARNQMKLPNLGGPVEFVAGDPLLRADTNLAYALDGVYRRGEFYLRWIQRFSSLFFGTPWGRVLTLYLLLPFGGAFLVLMTALEVQHIGGKVGALVSKSIGPKPRTVAGPAVAPVPTPKVAPAAAAPPPVMEWEFDDEALEFYEEEAPTPVESFDPDTFEFVYRERVNIVTDVLTSSASTKKPEEAHHGFQFITAPNLIGLGLFFLLVLHVPSFRRAVFALLALLWRGIRGVFWELPGAVWHSPALRAVRLSGTARFLRRHFFSPLLLALLAVGIFFILGVPLRFLMWWGLACFAVLTAFYNTPYGWLFQDRIAEALSDWWRIVRVNLIPGLIQTVLDWFRMLANWVERQLYRVDEWMRFRGGDSQGSFALKAVLGVVWFPVAYVTRFGFYLLFEPQVNPVKHFPVVTVSHKVIAPVLLGLVPALAEVVGQETAGTIYFFTQLLLPGVFGFLAWELKENWRLYAGNRSAALNPVVLGSHGESMRRLLRPGFHSGTVPKLHRQARHALERGETAKAAQYHHELHHAGEGVHRFVERELLPLLAGRPEWAGVSLKVSEVRFACQRVEIEIAAPTLGSDPLVISFENVGGVIEAGLPKLGWADKLTGDQRESLGFALRGLLDMGAAAKYESRERTTEGVPEPGFAALAQRVTWAEWSSRWGAARFPLPNPGPVS